jgi:hypothetical protein
VNEPLRKSDPQIVKEIAKEAEGLKANRAFVVATQILQKQWYGELLDPKTTDVRKVLELVAKLRALEAIPQMLDHLMTDQVMSLRGQHRA